MALANSSETTINSSTSGYHKRKDGKIIYFQDPKTSILYLNREFFADSEIGTYKSSVNDQEQMFSLSYPNGLATLRDVKDVQPLILNPELEKRIIEVEKEFGRVDYSHIRGAGSDGT